MQVLEMLIVYQNSFSSEWIAQLINNPILNFKIIFTQIKWNLCCKCWESSISIISKYQKDKVNNVFEYPMNVPIVKGTKRKKITIVNSLLNFLIVNFFPLIVKASILRLKIYSEFSKLWT
jgi:hypothetical protein